MAFRARRRNGGEVAGRISRAAVGRCPRNFTMKQVGPNRQFFDIGGVGSFYVTDHKAFPRKHKYGVFYTGCSISEHGFRTVKAAQEFIRSYALAVLEDRERAAHRKVKMLAATRFLLTTNGIGVFGRD